jgi:putative transposase
MAATTDKSLVLSALKRAVSVHRADSTFRQGKSILHQRYRRLASFYGFRLSMSTKGDCYDNAPRESFWGILKNELAHHRKYRTRAEAMADISEYIEIFYNRQRLQAGLGYLSPAEFSRLHHSQLYRNTA